MHPQLSRRLYEADIAGITEELCAERLWTVFSREFPMLDVGFRSSGEARLRLRLNFRQWNDIPPSIELLNYDGSPMTSRPATYPDIFHAGPHSSTGRPFICMRGSYEYHIHESHRMESWDDLRDKAGFRAGEIVTQVWTAWRRAHP